MIANTTCSSVRRAGPSRLRVALFVTLTLVANACTDRLPTAPQFDLVRLSPRRTEYICVKQEENGPVYQPLNASGGCDHGFEVTPWT